MTYESEGLPGIYRRDREARARASAPRVAKANRKEIEKIKERLSKIEAKLNIEKD